MTVDNTSGYLRAAADHVDDARTELDRAKEKAPNETIKQLIDRTDGSLATATSVLRELAINAEVEEQ